MVGSLFEWPTLLLGFSSQPVATANSKQHCKVRANGASTCKKTLFSFFIKIKKNEKKKQKNVAGYIFPEKTQKKSGDQSLSLWVPSTPPLTGRGSSIQIAYTSVTRQHPVADLLQIWLVCLPYFVFLVFNIF